MGDNMIFDNNYGKILFFCALFAIGNCKSALIKAVEKDDMSKAKLAIESGAKVNESAGTFGPLHTAAKNGSLEMAKFLIKNGANVNLQSSIMGTPLVIAISYKKYEIAKLLVENKADVNLSQACDGLNNTCWKPLHMAVVLGKKGYTPFGGEGEPEMSAKLIQLLLQKGADVNGKLEGEQQHMGGYTPLHWAAIHDVVAAAKTLLAKGADINAKNLGNNTPLKVAKSWRKNNMIEFLKSKGGKLK